MVNLQLLLWLDNHVLPDEEVWPLSFAAYGNYWNCSRSWKKTL